MRLKSAILAALAVATSLAALPATAHPTQEPNITGVWEIYPDPFAGDENTFLELSPPNGGPKLTEPYASQWKARRDHRTAMLKAGTPLADPSTLCIPEGMPTIMGAIFPFQILQTPGQVTVLAEFLTQTRRIFLNVPMLAPDDNSPTFYGFSTGRWEGDTLVVTTKGVQEDTQFFEIPHSSEMTITERIRLTAPNMLENQIVIDDPKTLIEPYRFSFGYRRNDTYRIMEYYCERQDPLLKVNPDGTVSMTVDAARN